MIVGPLVIGKDGGWLCLALNWSESKPQLVSLGCKLAPWAFAGWVGSWLYPDELVEICLGLSMVGITAAAGLAYWSMNLKRYALFSAQQLAFVCLLCCGHHSSNPPAGNIHPEKDIPKIIQKKN